jgi:hypothetical protein
MNAAVQKMFVDAPPEAILRIAEIGHLHPYGELKTPEDVAAYNTVVKIFSEGGVVPHFATRLQDSTETVEGESE